MIVYKFYLRDAINGDIFLGALPERRKNPQRITEESIINWGRTYFCKHAKGEDVLSAKTVWEKVREGTQPSLHRDRDLGAGKKLASSILRMQRIKKQYRLQYRCAG